MKSKSLMLMVLSMGFGLIAAIGISQVMGRSSGPSAEAPKMSPVLVAADNLDHKALLTEENVRIENWPAEIIPELAATSLDQIKDMVIRTRMSKGLPIMVSDLLLAKDAKDLPIPPGSKVIAIKVSEDDTIAGLLNPGDLVDVIGLFKTTDRSGEKRQFTKTFLKALRVFSVNAQMSSQVGSRTDTSTRGSAIVGVLVTEKQSEAIVYVQKTGQLKLVLRGDSVTLEDETVDDLDFLNQQEEKEVKPTETNALAKPDFGPRSPVDSTTMIVWKGNEPEKVVFKDGLLPQRASYQAPTQPRSSKVEDDDDDDGKVDEEDSDGFRERDRGLEEDQYLD